MRTIFRSLATIVLAATIPVIVFGSPRGGGSCVVVLIQFVELIENCETVAPTECIEEGSSNCNYDVLYVTPSGSTATGNFTPNADGNLTVSNCKSIQCKHCKSCPGFGGSCFQDDSPCF